MLPSIEVFEKAVFRLKDACDQTKNEYVRDSVIQRFEFCIELGWKTAKKTMGTSINAPKDVVRKMAQSDYVKDADVWLQAIDMRNLSSHTYNEDLAEKVYNFALSFIPQLLDLLRVLKSK